MRSNRTFYYIIFCAISFGISLSHPLFAHSDVPLKAVLDEHGRIFNPYRISGKVDFSGYIPVIDDCQGLLFVPVALAPGWNALGNGLNNKVNAIVVSGSDVYVGGSFTDAGGISDADNIALWNGSAWNAMGGGLNGAVEAIAISGSDVYVGGSFTDAGGSGNADFIAHWDGGAWNALGSGLTNFVNAIAISGSDVYVGGAFSDAGGNANADIIARWNGGAWHAMGSGFSGGPVQAISVSGSDIYAGGNFTYSGANSINRIARWDGSAWNAMGSGMNNWVEAIAVSGSDVYAGGLFSSAGGNSVGRIARWDGSAWNAIGAGLSSTVYTIAVSGGDVYAGGQFGGRIAHWDGSAWSVFGGGLNSTVFTVTASGSDLYVGGLFINAGSNGNADFIARWEATPLPVTLLSFQAQVKDKTTLLEWRTGSESDNEGWGIEHSTNARDWQTIGFMHSHGNANTENRYHFTHQTPASGPNYYRLRQIDDDGVSAYSPIATASVDEASGIQVYPTVTSGVVYVKSQDGPVTRATVLDAMGRVQAQVENTDHIDLSDKTPSAYFIRIEAEGKLTLVRVVKE